MFLLLPIIRWLAHHDRPAVVVGAAALLLMGGIAVAAAGIAAHQPTATRVGFIVLIITIIYATVAVRARHHRGNDRPRTDDDD
jgi:membrane protein implicated in regulation of membrane protease activity